MIDIYLIHATNSDFYKIGSATDVKRRLAALQTGCPFELKLLSTRKGTIDTELAIQHHLNDFRHRGEWFCFASPPQAMHYFGMWEPFRKPGRVVALDSWPVRDIESPGNIRA